MMKKNKTYNKPVYLSGRYFLLLLLLAVSGQMLIASDWKELIELNGYWKFNIGDDARWSDYNFYDDDWEEIRVPSSWEDEGYHSYNGYAWYRIHFVVPEEIYNKSSYISLGYIDDVDEAYLNGNLIGSSGSFPPNYETAYNAHRKYPVPSNYFYPGKENVIAVRVYDSRLTGGIVGGDISIMVLESLDMEINLEGYWKFNLGDDLSCKEPEFNDSDWSEIQVPSNWEIQGYPDYNGFAWYRKEIYIDDKYEGEKLIVLLGKIDDIDQCYLNGEMIGITGDFVKTPETNRFSNEWQELRGYYVPEKLIKYNEKNLIAVRVYDGFKGGGIYQGPIGITTQEEYRRYWKEKKRKKNFWEFIFED